MGLYDVKSSRYSKINHVCLVTYEYEVDVSPVRPNNKPQMDKWIYGEMCLFSIATVTNYCDLVQIYSLTVLLGVRSLK